MVPEKSGVSGVWVVTSPKIHRRRRLRTFDHEMKRTMLQTSSCVPERMRDGVISRTFEGEIHRQVSPHTLSSIERVQPKFRRTERESH